MDTVTLTISLPKDISSALEDKARQSGRDSSAFVEDLVAKEVKNPSLDEILAPFRKQVEESGLTDDQLDDIFNSARREVFREKRERLRG